MTSQDHYGNLGCVHLRYLYCVCVCVCVVGGGEGAHLKFAHSEVFFVYSTTTQAFTLGNNND